MSDPRSPGTTQSSVRFERIPTLCGMCVAGNFLFRKSLCVLFLYCYYFCHSTVVVQVSDGLSGKDSDSVSFLLTAGATEGGSKCGQ